MIEQVRLQLKKQVEELTYDEAMSLWKFLEDEEITLATMAQHIEREREEDEEDEEDEEGGVPA